MTNSKREITIKAGLMLLAVALPSLISNSSIRIITTAAVFIGMLSLLRVLTGRAVARPVADNTTDKQQGLDFKAA